MFKRKDIIFIIFFFLLLSITGIIGYLAFVPKKNTGGVFTFDNIHDFIVELKMSMKQSGNEKTFSELKIQLAKLPPEKQHTLIHVFGELLFQTSGIKGLTTCDDSFGFGCYHGFIGRSIAEKGVGIVKDLDAACVAQYGVGGLGCTHGIGHGLGEYFGPNRLNDQLKTCSTLTWKGKYLGCQGGVFMEYNFPTQTGAAGSANTMRTFDPNNPYDPCYQVPAVFRNECFFDLPTWWYEVLKNNTIRLGSLCYNVRETDYRESCYIGIGTALAPSLQYDRKKILSDCVKMPSEEGNIGCRAGSYWSFFANPPYRAMARELCEGLGDKVDRCVSLGDVYSKTNL